MNIKMSAFADEASRSIDGQIEAMKRNGIELLEIRFVGEKNIKDVTNIEAKEIKNCLADHGMRVWSIGSPTGKIKLEDDFEPHLESFKHQLELAQIMGADRYRLFSFYNTDNSEGCFQAGGLKMKIGAQMFTIREFCKTPEGIIESLEKLAEIGAPAGPVKAAF